MAREIEPIPADVDEVASRTFDAAIRVHRQLGPGLLESVYEECLAYELGKAGLSTRRQVTLPINYDGVILDAGLRLDIVVEEKLILELKAVEKIIPLHRAQLLTYLKLTGHRLGLIMNFNVELMKEGIKRVAN